MGLGPARCAVSLGPSSVVEVCWAWSGGWGSFRNQQLRVAALSLLPLSRIRVGLLVSTRKVTHSGTGSGARRDSGGFAARNRFGAGRDGTASRELELSSPRTQRAGPLEFGGEESGLENRRRVLGLGSWGLGIVPADWDLLTDRSQSCHKGMGE